MLPFNISEYALSIHYHCSLCRIRESWKEETRGFLAQHPLVTEEALEIYFEALGDAD